MNHKPAGYNHKDDPYRPSEETILTDKQIRELLQTTHKFDIVDKMMSSRKKLEIKSVNKKGDILIKHELAPEILIDCPVCHKCKANICQDTYGYYRFIKCMDQETCGLWLW